MNDKPAAPSRVDWRGADLRNGNYAGMSLEGADMRATDVSGSNFTGANLRYVDFRGAKMVGTTFLNANLYGAKMQGVEAFGADFRGSDVRQANFGGAYMDGAVMPPPSPADLVERNGAAAQPQTDKQPAERLNGQGTPSQQQDGGHKPGPNHRPKV